MYVIYALFFSTILLSIILFKQLKINFNIIATIMLTIFIIYFILFPKDCMNSTLNSSKFFIKSIFPSLFPFVIICNMLIAFDGIKIYSKIIGPLICKPLGLSNSSSFAIVASFLCGYPLGAKYSADLYNKKYINRTEFIRLLNIASNAGPLFIIGAIGSAMLNNPFYGYIILFSNYLSAILIGFFNFKKSEKSNLNPEISIEKINTEEKKNIGETLKTSILDAINSMLLVGGYVIFFSLLITIIKNNPISNLFIKFSENSELIQGFILGSLDLSNGTNIIVNTNLNLTIKLCLLSFICSFGSFSVIAQVNAFIYKYKVSITKYTLYKILQGIISTIICYILCFFTLNSTSVFNGQTSFLSYYHLMPTIIILFISIMSLLIYKLFNVS